MPVYQQVANVLRAAIIRQDGDRPVRLPNEEQLAATHGVARGTIRQALRVLAQEGLIRQARRRGTLTVPAGIAVWRKMHEAQIVRVLYAGERPLTVPPPNTFFGQILEGITSVCEQAGYQAAVSGFNTRFPPSFRHFQPDDPHQVIGLILVGQCDERLIAMHVEGGYPVVCTDYWPANPQADGIVFDCYGEGQLATEFLISQGHRHLFYLGNNLVDANQRERHESDADLMAAGFRRALEEAGLPVQPRQLGFVVRKERNLDAAAKWFLSLRPRPTGGIVFDSRTFEGLRERLARHGIRCPEDVSMICKVPVGTATKATCIRNDPLLMGRMAAELLLDRAAGKRRGGVRMAIVSTLERGNTVRCLKS